MVNNDNRLSEREQTYYDWKDLIPLVERNLRNPERCSLCQHADAIQAS